MDFQITLDKLANTRSTFFSDLQLTTYLHGIEDIYSDFAVLQRSATQTKVPNILIVIAELEDKTHTANKPTTLLAYFLNASWEKSYSRRNKNMRNSGRGFYFSR